MVAPPDEPVLVVDPMVEQLAVQRLRPVLELERVLVAHLHVDVQSGGGDQVPVALGQRPGVVGVEVGLVDRVAVELGDQSGVAVDHVA